MDFGSAGSVMQLKLHFQLNQHLWFSPLNNPSVRCNHKCMSHLDSETAPKAIKFWSTDVVRSFNSNGGIWNTASSEFNLQSSKRWLKLTLIFTPASYSSDALYRSLTFAFSWFVDPEVKCDGRWNNLSKSVTCFTFSVICVFWWLNPWKNLQVSSRNEVAMTSYLKRRQWRLNSYSCSRTKNGSWFSSNMMSR